MMRAEIGGNKEADIQPDMVGKRRETERER